MTALPPSGTFTMVDPAHVAAVGPAAAILYARIVWRSQGSGSWRATRRQLRDETGLSEATLRTAAEVLRDREWVATRRTSPEDATLIWAPCTASDLHMDDSAPPLAESAPPLASSTPTPPAESAMSSYETRERHTPLPPAGGDEPDLFGTQVGPRETPTPDPLRGFDDWWAAYPRKTAKADARKAWTAALKVAAPNVIQAGLTVQLRELREAHDRGFCPYPATWLRRRRWEDEAPSNVHPIRPDDGSLPPVKMDPFAARGGW